MPSAASAFAVPPLDKMPTPRAASSRANDARPVLSETETRAVRIAMPGAVALPRRRGQRACVNRGPTRSYEIEVLGDEGVHVDLDAHGRVGLVGGCLRLFGLVEIVLAALVRLLVGFLREDREAALAGRTLVDVVAKGRHVPERGELRQPLDLDLPDALAGEVHDGAHLLQRRAAAVGDVERARLRHFPDLEIGEVQLDRARSSRHVEIEVVLAGDEGARPRAAHAVRARLGVLDVVDLGVEEPPELEVSLRHPLDADRLGADRALATRAALLARHR